MHTGPRHAHSLAEGTDRTVMKGSSWASWLIHICISVCAAAFMGNSSERSDLQGVRCCVQQGQL